MNHCLRRWLYICSRCPILVHHNSCGILQMSTRKFVTLYFINHLQNMTFHHDMLLLIVPRPPLLSVMTSLSDLKQTVQMAFAGCFIFLIQSFSKRTSGSLDVHVIFRWDFLTSTVNVFSNHSHLHLFGRPASKSFTHPSPDCWRTCSKTEILFCSVV